MSWIACSFLLCSAATNVPSKLLFADRVSRYDRLSIAKKGRSENGKRLQMEKSACGKWNCG